MNSRRKIGMAWCLWAAMLAPALLWGSDSAPATPAAKGTSSNSSSEDESGTIDIGAASSSPGDPAIHPVEPGTPVGDPAGSASGAPGGDPNGGASGAPGGSPADPAKEKPPSIWIWQDSDDVPVKVKTKAPRRHMSFNPLTDTGFWMNVKGNAIFGASSQAQTDSPRYNNMTEGVQLDASGIIYSPGLVSYSLSTSYNKNQMGQGPRDNNLDGLSYGARVSLLAATPVPTTFNFVRSEQNSDGTLVVPYTSRGRNMDLSGTVLKLPVSMNWRLGTGFNDTTDILGRELDYHYRSGAIALAKNWEGFNFRVGDDYLKSKTDYDALDTLQTQNYLHVNIDRNFGSRLITYVEGVWTKYDFGQGQLASEKADVYSVSGGAHLNITQRLSADFTAGASRNAVNVLQLIAIGTGISVPNALPGVSVLDTRSRTANGNATYHPWKHWTFSGGAGYSDYHLPESVIAATPVAEQSQLSQGNISVTGAASYARPIWKLEYMGGISATLLQQSYVYSNSLDNKSIGYNVTNGISGGDEDTLRYGVRYTINHTDNPVFFDLINSNDKFLDADLSTHRFPLARITAKVEYRVQSILYAGSSQNQSGVNFLVTASRPSWDVTVGRLTTDATTALFNLVPGGATGVTPPGQLLAPFNFSRSKSDTASLTWRVRPALEINSRYSRLAYTLIGQGGNVNTNTQWDNYVIYHLGRFDIVGGYAYVNGYTGSYQRRLDLIYFRLKFPFALW